MNALDVFQDGWAACWSTRGLRGRRLIGPAVARARIRLNKRSCGARSIGFHGDAGRALWSATRELGRALEEPQSIPRVRLMIMDALREQANIDVLLMAPPSPFFGVSGDLIQFIDYIGRVDINFCKYFRRAPPWPRTFDDFVREGMDKHFRLSVLSTLFIEIRNTLERIHPDLESDWLLPFYMAMCIQSEMSYRRWVRAPAFAFEDIDHEMVEAAAQLRIAVAQPGLAFRLRSGRSWWDRVRWSPSLSLFHGPTLVGPADRSLEEGRWPFTVS